MDKNSKEPSYPSIRGDHLAYHRRPGDRFLHIQLPAKMHKVLGVPALFATAYGDVGSSIYYALGVVAMSALGMTPLVLMLAGLLFLFTALTYAEGATMLPEAGGSGAFARRAFNDLVSFITSWVLQMDYIVTISISAFTAANYFGYFFPIFKVWPYNSLGGVAIIVGLVVINIRGIQASSRFNLLLVLVDIVTQVSIAILGVLAIINIPRLIQNVHWGVAPTIYQLLFGISISMVAFTGIETIGNLGGETKNPKKTIPRSVLLVFITVILLYLFLSMTALSAYPVHQDPQTGQWITDLTQKFLQDPIMGIAQAMPLALRPILSFWVAILAVTILVIATNAGLIGASRLAYFMGQRNHLPAMISRVSPRSRVPTNAIVIFSVIAIILVSTGEVTLLVDLYAFGAVLAYTLAHVSIIALRIKEPNLPRPFKIPLNIRIAKRDIPIPAVLGALATAATWFVVVYTHFFGRIVGFIWLAIGLVIYILYRRSTHRSIIK